MKLSCPATWLPPGLTSPLATMTILAGLIFPVGCDRSDQRVQEQRSAGDSVRLVGTTATPQAIVTHCISAYRSLTSYQDAGVVALSYHLRGQPMLDTAPMSVAWDGQGGLGLRVYSLVAGPAAHDRWHLRLGDSQPELKSQVLSRPRPAKAHLDWLLSEPLVLEGLTAGLGGFPPQLDLLLSPNPLSGLLEDSSLSLAPPQAIDGTPCWIVSSVRGGLHYRLWIDQRSGLIRRLELPNDNLPQPMLADDELSHLSLTIELNDIRVNQPIDWKPFQVAVQPEDHRVSYFVAPPPKLDQRLKHRSLPAFQLVDAAGRSAYSSQPRPARKATVLAWLADHPACLAVAEQLAVAAETLNKAGLKEPQVEFVSVWAEPQPPAGMSFEQLQRSWQLPGKLVVDRAAAGRDLLQIDEAPTVVILDSQGQLQFLDVRTNPLLDRALVPLIERVAAGANLASELIEAQEHLAVRHRAQLALAASADQESRFRHGRESYPPGSLQLTENARRSLRGRVLQLTQDQRQAVWLLTGDGTLEQLDSNLHTQAQWQTDWTARADGPSRLSICPNGRYAAFASSLPNGPIELLDLKTRQTLRFPLPAGQAMIDWGWLAVPGTRQTRLAAITDGQQLLLLDTDNREPLSGHCPGPPVAIIDLPRNGAEISGLVALADGAVEPIHLAGQTGRGLGDPAADDRAKSHLAGERLGFIPAAGPWTSHSPSPGAWNVLAMGERFAEEPALFLLDAELSPQWLYRLPCRLDNPRPPLQFAVATDPASGATLWSILDTDGTIHLLRGDGSWTDLFRPAETAVAIALLPAGDRLTLLLATTNSLVAYRLH